MSARALAPASTRLARAPERRELHRAAPWALLLALLATWALWYPPSPDLAAQAFRVHLFATDGFALWDNSWYGGHYLPGYSLLFPALATTLGLRTIGALSVAISVWAFVRLSDGRPGLRSNAAAAGFVAGACGDLFIGRLAFALGVTFGMLSVLAAVRGSRSLTAALSLTCAAASPVAAAFLALVAAADWLTHRDTRRALALGAPALALTGALALLTPEGGYEPFAWTSLLAASGAALAVLVLVPARERLVRATSALYVLALALSYLVASPMGSNAVRFGVLFAPPALLGYARAGAIQSLLTAPLARLRTPRPLLLAARRLELGKRTAIAVLAATVAATVAWQVNGPLSQSIGASLNPASRASFYTPVIRYLQGRIGDRPERIEVPFTSSHWDAAILGAHFILARGWERQVDTRFDSLFYEPNLTAAAYAAWLRENGVRFVALSDAPLDFSSIEEAALISAGQPFLRPVFESAHWRVYEVRSPQPLASGPGALTTLGGDGFALHANAPGWFLVRVHYTPYWSVTSGSASVSATARDWTAVYARRPGTIALDAQFSLAP